MPGTTVKLAGTLTAAELLTIVTTVPVAGANPSIVTVPRALAPPTSVKGETIIGG